MSLCHVLDYEFLYLTDYVYFMIFIIFKEILKILSMLNVTFVNQAKL